MESREVSIKPMPPFNFDGTVYVPHYFPTPDYEWRPNLMWKTLNLDRKLYGLKMENMGTTDKPRIKLTIYCKARIDNEEMEKVLRELDWRYGFDEDISEFLREFKDDEFLKPVFKRWRGMRVNCDSSLYELLIISIVLQNE